MDLLDNSLRVSLFSEVTGRVLRHIKLLYSNSPHSRREEREGIVLCPPQRDKSDFFLLSSHVM